MLLRKMQPAKIVALGMIFVGVATAAQWYLQRHSGWSGPTAAFASGLLYGVAIGTLALGIWRQVRSRREGR